MKVQAELDPESLRRVRDRLLGVKKEAYAGLRTSFESWGERWQRGISARFTGSTGPTSLRNRSGKLQGSITHKVNGSSLDDLELNLKADGTSYARIHEFGGEIRPKNSKFLTIPTAANLTAAGNAREPSARAFIDKNQGDTFFLRTEAGGREHLLLMWSKPGAKHRKSGGAAKGNAVAMFRLVKKVDLPGPKSPSKKGPSRLGFFDTWKGLEARRRKDLAAVSADIAAGVKSAVGGA